MLASIHYGGRSAPKESTSSRALGPTRLTTRGLCAHLLRDLPRTYAQRDGAHPDCSTDQEPQTQNTQNRLPFQDCFL